MEDNYLVYSFPRCEGEDIQVAVRKYKGKYYVDVRLWYLSKNEQTLLPTKKGVSFPIEKALELQKAAERLCEHTKNLELKKEEAVS